MARLLRVQFNRALYHGMARGNERRRIFRGDPHRRRCLRSLAEAQHLHRVRLYLVCLLPNHFHLLVEAPAGDLSAFMARVLTSSAVSFNRRHGRAGHLTQAFGREEAALRRRSRGALARGAAAWASVRHAGLSERAAAEVLWMGTGAAVSQQLARWGVAVSNERRLQEIQAQLEQKLSPS